MLFFLLMADAYLGGEKSSHSFILFFEIRNFEYLSFKRPFEEIAGDMQEFLITGSIHSVMHKESS